MTAPVFRNGEWLLPEDHDAQEKTDPKGELDRGGLGGSNFKGVKQMFERSGVRPSAPHDPAQAQNRKVMMNEFMSQINDPTTADNGSGINAPKTPDGGRAGRAGWQTDSSDACLHMEHCESTRGHSAPYSPSHTIEQLPENLRNVLLDWAHQQDRIRNDGRNPRMENKPSAPGSGFTGSVSGGSGGQNGTQGSHFFKLAPDAQAKLLHPKKKYYTDSNNYDTSGQGNREFSNNVQQKQVAKQIAETLLGKDERGHDMFNASIERNFDVALENYIRSTRWKTGADGHPEYPTPVKDYLTHRFLAIDATQPVVTNHHQHIFTKNEFEHHHHTERAPHGGVTPEQAYRLIMGLKDTSNRGAGMFEEARQRAEKYVIDESNVTSQAKRALSPSVQKMLLEVNEPHDRHVPDAVQQQSESIDELKQIIRAQQQEIQRLRAALKDGAEIPAAPTKSDDATNLATSLADAAADAPAPVPEAAIMNHDWSRRYWPFPAVA